MGLDKFLCNLPLPIYKFKKGTVFVDSINAAAKYYCVAIYWLIVSTVWVKQAFFFSAFYSLCKIQLEITGSSFSAHKHGVDFLIKFFTKLVSVSNDALSVVAIKAAWFSNSPSASQRPVPAPRVQQSGN